MKALVTVLHGLRVSSITYDNGLAFSMHELVNELLECESDFCKPCRSRVKGGGRITTVWSGSISRGPADFRTQSITE